MARYARLADPLDSANKPGDGPLRVGGNSTLGLPATAANLPSTLSPSAKRQLPAVLMLRDLVEGAEQVRARGPVYLPQSPGEAPNNYNDRLDRSVFFEFIGDTIEGMTGMVFRKDPVLGDDVPPQVVEQWENLDNAGTSGDVLIREIFQDAITAGHAAILVEFPATRGLQSLRDEQGDGQGEYPIRPYWVPIKKENILSWRTSVEQGVTVLRQIVLKECSYVPDGAYGEQEQTRYRVFYNEAGVVGFTLLEVLQSRVVVEVDRGTYPTQPTIPIVEVRTSGRRGLFDSRPPLQGLGYLNVAHYQQWSDQATSIHKTCVPIFVRIGFEAPVDGQGNRVTLGPDSGLDLPISGDAKYVSHDGASLGSVKASIDDLVAQIATLGLSMLASEKRVAETATAKRIDKSATDSALAVTARGMQDAVEQALLIHARYLNVDDGGSVEINRDYENLTLDAQQIGALSALVVNGHLTIETLWKMLAAGNVLPDDFTPDDEKAALDAEAELKRVESDAAAQRGKDAQAANDSVTITNPDGTTRALMTRGRFPKAVA
jgi:hypothetical protein